MTEYTREAGVRGLERELGTVLRKTATKIASGDGRGAGGDRRRAGVRDALGRQRFFQEAAERTAMPGVATGLAVTGAGGDVLFIEATVDEGQGRPRAHRPARRRDEGVGADRALLRARPRRTSWAIDEDRFDEREFHVHVPAGAIPKDGPSAGITMTTALASLLTGGRCGTPSA